MGRVIRCRLRRRRSIIAAGFRLGRRRGGGRRRASAAQSPASDPSCSHPGALAELFREHRLSIGRPSLRSRLPGRCPLCAKAPFWPPGTRQRYHANRRSCRHQRHREPILDQPPFHRAFTACRRQSTITRRDLPIQADRAPPPAIRLTAFSLDAGPRPCDMAHSPRIAGLRHESSVDRRSNPRPAPRSRSLARLRRSSWSIADCRSQARDGRSGRRRLRCPLRLPRARRIVAAHRRNSNGFSSSARAPIIS